MGQWWEIKPDGERQQWALDPLVGVGPLRFGMTSDEVTDALDRIEPNPRWGGVHGRTMAQGRYAGVGMLYYRDERLHGISIDALGGPQVVADGMALVGKIPSAMTKWLEDRAEVREIYTELFYLPSGDPGSRTLGVAMCVQRSGDHVVTRPVFLPPDALDDIYHQLPAESWSIH